MKSEIKRQLAIKKSEITSVGYPHVILNGEELLAFIENLESEVRRKTVEDCIKQLGGRYGAAARKDLTMLLQERKEHN